jgi:hypothetical protein
MIRVLPLVALLFATFGLSACVVEPVGPRAAFVAPGPVVVGVGECWRCGWHRW